MLTNNEIENLLNTDKHLIVIYFHGNTFDRTTSHRCNLYNFLSNMDFHIIAIDYRGKKLFVFFIFIIYFNFINIFFRVW